MATQKHSVLFVCLGNICRSTMAEGILQHLIKQRGLADSWTVDSCGTGSWHIGSPPDSRTMQVLKKNGINDYHHRGRLITKDDFRSFEYIFGMDHENMEDITEMKPQNGTAKCMLLGEFDPQKELTVQDPYFTHSSNKNAFNEVYDQCHRCCEAFLESLNL